MKKMPNVFEWFIQANPDIALAGTCFLKLTDEE